MTPLKKGFLTAEGAEFAELSLGFLCDLGVLSGEGRLFSGESIIQNELFSNQIRTFCAHVS
jgi:hypothetical protein